MTILGVISDVHGDLEMLQAALDELSRRDCRRVVCCGDLVGYGRFHEQAVQMVMEHGIECVGGNWDRWAAEEGGGQLGLSAESRAFLAGLPESLRLTVGDRSVFVCHGAPDNALRHMDGALARYWLRDLEADVLLTGHTHRPASATFEEGVWGNPGSLWKVEQQSEAWVLDNGQWVRDEQDRGGSYGVLDGTRFEVCRL